MHHALLGILLFVSLLLIGLILLQQGKGASMGASFGAGASGTLFGSSGSGNFMTRMTAILATLFFILSLLLGNINSNKTGQGSVWDQLTQPEKSETTQGATKEKVPAETQSDIPR